MSDATERVYAGASPKAIQHHYDLSNAFYATFLDPSMTYSCALWEGADDTLERAQERKIDWHIRHAGVERGAHVLEVGCGWGSVMRRLLEAHGVEGVVGLTLSSAQVDFIRERPDPRLDARCENWFDHAPKRPYDALISVGAIEAFCRPGMTRKEKVESYRTFFRKCHRWLRPRARMSMQAIAFENTPPGELSPFMQTEIFPESEVPRLSELSEAIEGLFEMTTLRADREDYERTCREWLGRLKARRVEALGIVGEEAVARYEKYFKMCVVGFHIAKITLLRFSLRRIDKPYPGALGA